jgi:hypothetical protein
MAEHSIGAHCAGWSRVTDNDPPAIGARLAYGYGVCSAITMVERELTVLGRTVTASGAMLETMTHLGERLSPFDINAAPISAPTDAGHPHARTTSNFSDRLAECSRRSQTASAVGSSPASTHMDDTATRWKPD